MTTRASRTVLALLMVTCLAIVLPARAAFAFDDVPKGYWDEGAIDYMANQHTWMEDYGSRTFKPGAQEIRKYLARTLVTIYAPNEQPDDDIKINDVPRSDPFWKWINVSIKLGWMPKYGSGNWAPSGSIRVAGFDRAIVLALGLKDSVSGLANIHMANGTKYTVSADFPFLNLGRVLQLHLNHSNESMDIEADDLIARDEVAYSIWWAKVKMSWQIYHAKQWYTHVELPTLHNGNQNEARQRDATAYALNQVGYPYIYSGEWYQASPPNYCCGPQPKGGFDCSGFAWWVMKQYESNYNAAQFRPYDGWSLLQRSSSQMAQYTDDPIDFRDLRPGDLMFFASNKGTRYQDVDHVGIFLGDGWFIHSASSNDGVMLDRTSSDTYYYGEFVYGRRLIGNRYDGIRSPGDSVFVPTLQTLLEGDPI
jgi:hypothetical protein